jgi:hypothetical protein
MWNIGWLERRCDYATWDPPIELLARLQYLCLSPTNGTMGYCSCSLCGFAAEYPITIIVDGTPVCLGSAEIRIQSREGRRFVCPDMVYHYVQRHKYRPPAEFIDAVMQATISDVMLMALAQECRAEAD